MTRCHYKMDMKEIKISTQLMGYLRSLENRDSLARGEQIQVILKSLGVKTAIQERRHPRIRNISVDFAAGATPKPLIFSAHYDAVKNSPAANDNASGVAVLLGLCEVLKKTPAPVKVIFFDREEAWLKTPWLRLGLLGSLYYVSTHNLKNIEAVYNLEFCGRGEDLAIWPVKKGEQDLPVIQSIEKAAAELQLNYRSAHLPWLLLSSDHLSFRLKGMSNAVTLSMIPRADIPAMERLVSNLRLSRLLLGDRPVLPEILSCVHTSGDTSSQLNEDSLRLMLSILLQIIRNYASI